MILTVVRIDVLEEVIDVRLRLAELELESIIYIYHIYDCIFQVLPSTNEKDSTLQVTEETTILFMPNSEALTNDP